MPTAETRASARPAFQICRKPQFPVVLPGPPKPVNGKNGAGKLNVVSLVMLTLAVSLTSILRACVVPGWKGDVGVWVIVVNGGVLATDAGRSAPSKKSFTVVGSTILVGVSSIVATRLVKVAVTVFRMAFVTSGLSETLTSKRSAVTTPSPKVRIRRTCSRLGRMGLPQTNTCSARCAAL